MVFSDQIQNRLRHVIIVLYNVQSTARVRCWCQLSRLS